MDALGIGLSGMQAAQVRLAASAHNVANFTTDGVRPLRVVQSTLAGGGATARAVQTPAPEPVDLAHELVEQMLAKHQFGASLRAVAASSDMLGSVLDVFA